MDSADVFFVLLCGSLIFLLIVPANIIWWLARSRKRHETNDTTLPTVEQRYEQSGGNAGSLRQAVEAEVGVVADGSPTNGGTGGYRVKTMLGTAVFRNSLAVGRFGDWLTAQHYTRRRSGRYAKLKSKLPGEKGIDGVYLRCGGVGGDIVELVVVENKINSGRLKLGRGQKPNQLSVGWVISRCRLMMKTGDAELVRTACMLLNALHYPNQTRHRITRLLITHDLVSGESKRHHVDEDGRKSNRQGRWRNHARVRTSLERKLAKKEIWLDDQQ